MIVAFDMAIHANDGAVAATDSAVEPGASDRNKRLACGEEVPRKAMEGRRRRFDFAAGGGGCGVGSLRKTLGAEVLVVFFAIIVAGLCSGFFVLLAHVALEGIFFALLCFLPFLICRFRCQFLGHDQLRESGGHGRRLFGRAGITAGIRGMPHEVAAQ